MPTPKYGVAYTVSRSLYSVASPGEFQVNPTLAVGDVKIRKDSGAFVNITTLPTVNPPGSDTIDIVFSAAEMQAGRMGLALTDQAGNEWGPLREYFDIPMLTVDDTPTAIQNADALLTRDWALLGGEPPTYSAWNALRHLRNAWGIVANVLHIKREDGVTDAWTRPVTSVAHADPVTGVQ